MPGRDHVFFARHVTTTLSLIDGYHGEQPLAIYLKAFFAQHKKYGSKDRKQITHLCYCYYRSGFAFESLQAKERLLIAVFLCSEKTGDWLSFYDANWQKAYSENIDERIRFVQSLYAFEVTAIFYNNDYISAGIDIVSFNASHLRQPDVFLRLRPGKEQQVKQKLQQQEIPFTEINDSCLTLNNATKLDGIIDLNKEAVIQDASSQQVASFFSFVDNAKLITAGHKSDERGLSPKKNLPLIVWDCCAASGGKSILAYDFFPRIQLTVSDIRESIIRNLRERFKQAGITQYKAFAADVSSPQFLPEQQYDLVICDAPCSGSGTWSRTPEQLCFFTEDKLNYYIQLQKRITFNAIKAVKTGGCFLYITCSVFRQENEEMVSYIQNISSLTLVKADVIKGYDKKADTMFAALFVREELVV